MKTVLLDIWQSFRSLPHWVQIWVGVILVPVNLASVFFWSAPGGALIAILAVGGMTPNAVLMFVERGFSKAMALSHLVFWIPLLIIIAPEMGGGSVFTGFLAVLFVVDAISVCFDLKDSWQWLKGDRAVAR